MVDPMPAAEGAEDSAQCIVLRSVMPEPALPSPASLPGLAMAALVPSRPSPSSPLLFTICLFVYLTSVGLSFCLRICRAASLQLQNTGEQERKSNLAFP